MSKELLVILIQILIVFSIVLIITFLIMLDSAIRLRKRITKNSIRYNKSKNTSSLFDNIYDSYLLFVKKQRKKMSNLFPKLGKKYDKYVTDDTTRGIDFITHKIVICIIFIILVILTSAIQGKLINIYQIIFSLIFGFYILDIILYLVNINRKKKIENDMLQAIIIMNNAFKAGKSTIQAVEIAYKKLPKPINMEFKRILDELRYGLRVDAAFDRFAKRVNIPEAEYLSSSLTILNKTGGNIIGVFNSIEKTLFDKKKLKEELKNSTTVSKLVTKILLVIPALVVLIIYILDSSYFDPFFNSPVGILMLGFALVMFIIYAYLLEKIVKVDY